MPKIELPDSKAGPEPTPRFATDAEVAFAERLRHDLEKRYLGPSTAGDMGRNAHPDLSPA